MISDYVESPRTSLEALLTVVLVSLKRPAVRTATLIHLLAQGREGEVFGLVSSVTDWMCEECFHPFAHFVSGVLLST